MGLRYEDLKDLIIPLIGVDKFQPKTGTEAEVIVAADEDEESAEASE